MSSAAELEVIRQRWVDVPALSPRVVRQPHGFVVISGSYRTEAEAQRAAAAIAMAEGDVLRLLARIFGPSSRISSPRPPAPRMPRPASPTAPGETLGARICHFREAKGMTQHGLAFKVGTSQKMISKYELDEATPSRARLLEIARALGVRKRMLDPAER